MHLIRIESQEKLLSSNIWLKAWYLIIIFEGSGHLALF